MGWWQNLKDTSDLILKYFIIYFSIISLKYGKADLLNDALEKHNYNEKHHLLDKHNNI